MTGSRGRLIFGILAFGFSSSAVGYQLVQTRLGKTDVREFVEAQASRFLKADVKMAKVSYRPPVRVVLQGIQIENAASLFSIGEIQRLVFGYGLLNLLRRDFKIPSTFQLDSPKIRFRSSRVPFPFLDAVSTSSEKMLSQIVIQKGEFHYPWRSAGQELILSNVYFRAMPDVRGRIRLDLASEMAGIARGSIRVHGFTDPHFRRYQLEAELRDVSFLPESQIPLKKIRGSFRISDQTIEVLGLSSLFHDREVQWKGKIENWQLQPDVSLEMVHRKGEFPFGISLGMNFGSRRMKGEWSWLGQVYPFQGEVIRGGEKIVFQNLLLPRGYGGSGELDPSNGDYRFSFQRDRRRFQIHSNLSRLEFDTEFQLDHASINRLDWVVRGRLHLVPLPLGSEEDPPRFQGQIQTDYLIIEFQPFENFKGGFELSPEGVSAIDCRWGGVFHLEGRILFKGRESREDLVLRIEGFPLENVGEFAGRPLSTRLAGSLEGKLKMRGEPRRPEVQGYFTIKDGTIDKVDFDRALIQFQGFPPYLRLYDSKIFKGRNTLKLIGALDLRLQNYLHGIQIKGPDHLVIWKGMSAYWKEGESAIEAEKPLGDKVAMGLEVGAGVSNSKADDPDENHAVIGSKVRF